jgi:hypothetical protein
MAIIIVSFVNFVNCICWDLGQHYLAGTNLFCSNPFRWRQSRMKVHEFLKQAFLIPKKNHIKEKKLKKNQ